MVNTICVNKSYRTHPELMYHPSNDGWDSLVLSLVLSLSPLVDKSNGVFPGYLVLLNSGGAA